MEIIAFLAENAPWSWIVGGLALLALELVLPGGFLVWLGISAVIVGLATLVQPLSWPLQWALYGVLSVISVVTWLNFGRKLTAVASDKPLLNDRAAQLVGQEAVLKDPIENGTGRIVMGDGIWRVKGPDLPQGTRVRIIGAEGAVLIVETR